MCCLFGDKPRERDFLKTLRLVSGTEACALEQHGDTVDDDDKGVRVAHLPTPFNRLTQSVQWISNRSRETIPQSNVVVVRIIAVEHIWCKMSPQLIGKQCHNLCLHDRVMMMMQRNVHLIQRLRQLLVKYIKNN